MARTVYYSITLLSFMSMMQIESVASFTTRAPHVPISRSRSVPFMALDTSTKESDVKEIAVEENPRMLGLALMLDDGTRKSHSMAQNSAFVSGFFKGLSTREAYRALITSLYFVYSAMEDAFDDPNVISDVHALDDAELRRMSALKQDMDYFYGVEWESTISPSPSTKSYVARVRHVAEHKPYLLIAHQYTRYLGDLFGGQMMGGMATRSLDLEQGKGVAFYNFDDIPSTKNFITDWYQRLNALDLTEEQKMEIVDEANNVFDLNIGILEELEGSPLKAMWSLALNTLKMKLGIASR
mmetsp:Transcript_24893/g.45073  ORF Transcript_24893/g.45073 Transcript_24893/m.45073 type:complete len:297 (-) Transcript_24893:87-977(-)